MPDANGRIRGISTAGVKNRWLDIVSYLNALEREMKRLEREEVDARNPAACRIPSRSAAVDDFAP